MQQILDCKSSSCLGWKISLSLQSAMHTLCIGNMLCFFTQTDCLVDLVLRPTSVVLSEVKLTIPEKAFSYWFKDQHTFLRKGQSFPPVSIDYKLILWVPKSLHKAIVAKIHWLYIKHLTCINCLYKYRYLASHGTGLNWCENRRVEHNALSMSIEHIDLPQIREHWMLQGPNRFDHIYAAHRFASSMHWYIKRRAATLKVLVIHLNAEGRMAKRCPFYTIINNQIHLNSPKWLGHISKIRLSITATGSQRLHDPSFTSQRALTECAYTAWFVRSSFCLCLLRYTYCNCEPEVMDFKYKKRS